MHSPKQSLELTTNLSEIQGIEEHRDAIINIQAGESSAGTKTWFLQQLQQNCKKTERKLVD